MTYLGNQLRSHDDKKMIIMAYPNEFNGYAVDEAEYGLYFETFMSMYPKGKADLFIQNIMKLYQGKSEKK